MFAHLSLLDDGSLLARLQVKPTWTEQIRGKQLLDGLLVPRFRQVENGEISDFGLNSDGVLCFRGRVCVPRDLDLRQSILQEVHGSPNAMHPGGNKLYRDLHELYWWPGLKREVTDFDSVWVIVDRLTKSAHFIPARPDYSLQKLAKLYVDEIVRLHGVPVSIISDRILDSHLSFRRNYTRHWVQGWTSVLRFILRQTISQKG
ncbi:uncharacterized protein LOC108465231 [Gossypium arboreum]|uniref:uncharacterized protein LOC108465231 n=1 Tax=Gossypium arboreum TaxID=29729 RepID=UPI000818F3B9|nr:uncharacterized protein LOC108465231 [Gossypium arboreum]